MYHLTGFFFFFFQAEDGIRDDLVTGVQTCALPILPQVLAIQIIDVLPAYTQDLWQIQAVNRMLEGLDDLISFWHICYGSVDAQTDVWEDKAAEMMPMFESANVTAIHFESSHRDFREMEWYRSFPRNKVLGLGFIDVKEPNVEKPEQVANRIRRVLHARIVSPDRLLAMPDCALGY